MSAEQVKTLSDLLHYLTIPSTDWDYLIVGDGSGTTWSKEFGWGATLICRHGFERKLFYGSMSLGTNNMAELLAVLHPLMYLSNTQLGENPSGIKVHVVSDSEYVVNGLKKQDPIWVSQLEMNRELWMAIHMTRRRGLTIVGHHILRDTIDLNRLGHDLANLSRKSLIEAATQLPHDPYEMNPDASDPATDV